MPSRWVAGPQLTLSRPRLAALRGTHPIAFVLYHAAQAPPTERGDYEFRAREMLWSRRIENAGRPYQPPYHWISDEGCSFSMLSISARKASSSGITWLAGNSLSCPPKK